MIWKIRKALRKGLKKLTLPFSSNSKNFKAFIQSLEYYSIDELKNLIVALGKQTQLQMISDVFETNSGFVNKDFFFLQDMFFNLELLKKYMNLDDPYVRIESGQKIDLKTNLVFSQPWSRKRINECFRSIAYNEENNESEWEQQFNGPDDPHAVKYIEPFGISVVQAGNHSIAVGILREGGKMIATESASWEQLISKVISDGDNYYFLHDHGKVKISKVKNYTFALIWEIGRLILQKDTSNIKFKAS